MENTIERKREMSLTPLILLIVTLAIFYSSFCLASEDNGVRVKSYMGVEYPPLPSECVIIGWAFLGLSDLSYSKVECSGERLFWLAVRSQSVKSQINWKIVDQIEIPSVLKDQDLVSYDCSYNDVYNPMVFAIGVWIKKQTSRVLSNIKFSFMVDVKRKRIFILDHNNVNCYFDDYDDRE